MSLDTVREHLKKFNRDKDIIIVDGSSRTVNDAAIALNTNPDNIAKTLALSNNEEGCIILVTSGESRLDNLKFRKVFGYKPRMLSYEDTYKFTSHQVGGVCPFGLTNVSEIYLDESLKKHDIVYPACGSGNSAIKLTISELEEMSGSKNWIDVCK